MMERNNASCSICEKAYYMCISCKDMISLSPWKVHTDTSEHYKIYQIIHGYSTGVYNKKEAKSKLQKVDLSDLESFKDNIKTIIKDIMKEDKVVNMKAEVEIVSEEVNMPLKNNEDKFISNELNLTRKKKSFKAVETE